MKLYIADAFTNQIFGGNPAGVVLVGDADFPSDETMRKTAVELRYSETVFIKQVSADRLHLRYFTPAGEVDLCGHATIAAFKCLLAEGMIKDNATYIYDTLAGTLQAELRAGYVMMGMAKPALIHTIEDSKKLEELYEIMGAKSSGIDMLPKIISTGLPDIIMPVASKQDLYDLKPDFKRLTQLSRDYNVVGVHAFALGDEKITAYARNFAPLYDIDEEAATGTSNGALTFYLFMAQKVYPENTNVIIQGETMGRPSRIQTSLYKKSDEEINIKVGGDAVILARGEIFI